MTQPADPRAVRLTNLARTLQAIPHIDRHSDCGCPRCRARTWTQTGYPASTLGDGTGSRTADTTSSTERHALALLPPTKGVKPPPAPTHLTRWDAAIGALDLATITIHNLLVELGYDPTDPDHKHTTDDHVAVGRGNCQRCNRFCIGDGENNRLRAGLCTPCYAGLRRWRILNPGHNVTDYIRHNPARIRTA